MLLMDNVVVEDQVADSNFDEEGKMRSHPQMVMQVQKLPSIAMVLGLLMRQYLPMPMKEL